MMSYLDVTDRERAERALRESEARYREIINASPVPCALNDAGGRITFLNKAFVKTFGYTLEAVPTLADWWPKAYPEPKYCQWVVDTWGKRLAAMEATGKPFEALEVSIRAKDGRELIVVADTTPLSGTSDSTHLVTLFDLTAIRRAEELSRQVVEASPIPSLLHSEGQTLFVNSAFTRVFGYELADVPTVERWREHAYPDPKVRQRVLEIARAAYDDAKNTQHKKNPRFYDFGGSETVKIRTKYGTDVVALGYLTAFGDSDLRVLLSFVDITDRVELQEKLRQADKTAAIGQLTGGVAHDVNNSLAVIMGSAELLHEQAAKGSYTAELAKRILKAGRRSADLVKRLMVVARKAEIKPVELELPAVLGDIIETLKRTLGGKIDVSFTPPQGSFLIQVDRAMLESSLINLSVNARDAMPDGGKLTFAVTSEPATISGAPDWVVLSVTDTGTGMTEEVRKRVFEAFFTTKPSGSGTGLGLAMVHGFIEQSGGTIEVASTPGKGSTFTLRFPGAHASTDKAVPLLKAGRDRRAGEDQVVLLVDDNDAVRTTLKEQLSASGCHVIETGTCEQAQKLIRLYPEITFVLSDLDLGPGPSGLDLAEWAQREGFRIPGAIVSGYLNVPTDRIAATGWAQLQKPVRIGDLGRLLKVANPPQAPVG